MTREGSLTETRLRLIYDPAVDVLYRDVSLEHQTDGSGNSMRRVPLRLRLRRLGPCLSSSDSTTPSFTEDP